MTTPLFRPLRALGLACALALTAAAPLALTAAPAVAADVPTKKTAQVKSGLYVTAQEAFDMMQADPSVVLIDVRDPVEVMFTGFATDTDIHVPYKMANRSKLNAEKGVWSMETNPAFADEVEAKLAALNVPKDAKLVFMCRSGSTRSAPAADMLHDRGWTNAYTMVDGFEGGTRKDGPSAGVRDVSGWRNSGLPWSYTLPEGVVYVAKD